MNGTMNVSLSNEYREFLEARFQAGKEDVSLAHRFLYHEVDHYDPDAHNYYDIKLVDGEPRISFSTMARCKAAACFTSYDAIYEPGGHRTLARPARVAQRVTGVKDGRALDVFTTALAAWLSPEAIEVTVVAGREITRRYHQRHHCHCLPYLGDLTNSCMRHGFRHRFGLYEDCAQLAIVTCPECDGTQLRALLWTDIDGQTWLDRIYGPERLAERARSWATAQGHEVCWPGDAGKAIDRRVVVAAPRKDYPEAPYLDSLFFWCRECGTLSNQLDPMCEHERHDWVKLHGTEGTTHSGWWGRCAACGQAYDEAGEPCHSGGWCNTCSEPLCASAETCSQGHRHCAICAHAVGDDGRCERGCVVCPGCEMPLRYRDVLVRHGRTCPCCETALVLDPAHLALTAPTLLPVRMDQDTHLFHAECPCGCVIEGYRDAERYAVAMCRSPHADDAACRGHCPACLRPLVLDYDHLPSRGTLPRGSRYASDSTTNFSFRPMLDWLEAMESRTYPRIPYPSLVRDDAMPEDEIMVVGDTDIIEPFPNGGGTFRFTGFLTDNEEGETDEANAA